MSITFPDGKPLLKHVHSLRSRYAETDQMGYVYYGNYLEYFEVARTEMIRTFGLTYSELESNGIMLPVVHAAVDYKEPLLYDEPFNIHTFMFQVPGVKLDTWYKITDAANERTKAIGNVVLVFMDATTRRPVRAPQYFAEGLKKAGIL
jgi:acyl-CoA thioester hydrolase